MNLWLQLLPKAMGLVGSACLLKQALHLNKIGKAFHLISKAKPFTEKTKILKNAHDRLENKIKNQVLKWTWWNSFFLYFGITLIISSYLVELIIVALK